MENSSDDQAAAEALWRSPATLKRAYVDYRHGQLHYRTTQPAASSKLPMLMFHQTGSSGRCYEDFVAEMGRDRIAMIVDTPSSGASDPLPKVPHIEDFADVMEEFIDRMIPGRFDLVGDHTGAMTAVEVAKRRPHQVRRVVLNASPVFVEGETTKITFPRRSDLEGSHMFARWKRVMSFFGHKSIPLGELEFIEGLRAGPFMHHGPHAVFSYPLKDNLTKVTQRMLVLRAQDDLWVQTDRARPFLCNAEMIDLPQYGREMLMANYREVAAIVRPFLDQPE